MIEVLQYCTTNKIKWALFDFFDTIVCRNCSPDDIKRFWAKKMFFELSCLFPKEFLYKVRCSSEQYLKQKNNVNDGEFTYYNLSKEIFQRLIIFCAENRISFLVTQDEFLSICLQTEINIEKEYQYLKVGIIETIKALNDKDISLAIVSDFYLDRNTIELFLENFGIKKYFKMVFVSSDCKKNKHTGNIYPYVLSTIMDNANECVMVGDTYLSDVYNAQKYGIKGFLVEKAQQKKISKENIISKFKSIYKEDKKNTLAYSNYCFLLLLFIERLYKNLIKDNIRTVYFLSREGEFLKKIFDIYKDQVSSDIESRYLYVSRKSTLPASLSSLKHEDFNVFSAYAEMSLSDFLVNIGFDDNKIVQLKDSININFDNEIFDFFNSDIFIHLKNNELFNSLWEQNRIESKNLILKYFADEKFNSQEKIALVDVGWSGTMQNNIKKICEKSMIGYYIGVSNKAECLKDNVKKGLVFTAYPQPSKDFYKWSYDSVFLERILFASHPATDGYLLQNGIVKPAFRSYACEEENFKKIKPVQDKILVKFKKLCEVINSSPYLMEDFYDFILKSHLDTVFNVNIPQLKLQKLMYDNQIQNFGNIASAKECNDKIFGIKSILKKIKGRLSVLKNTEMLFRFLMHYNLLYTIKLLYKVKKFELNLKKRSCL